MNSVKHPIVVIINGANWVGSKITELMIEQKGNVIIVDDFTSENLPFIKRFSGNKNFVFIERDKIDSLRQNFTQIKYIIHLKNDLNHKNSSLSSKAFIYETQFADEVLTIALEKNSTYVLTSSIHLHRDFVLKQNYQRGSDAYKEADLQDYLERTVIEYTKKAGLDGRIVRLGNIYGPEMDLDEDEVLKKILLDAFYRDEVRVYGDGLEYMYYVYVTDAIQGILRALFIKQTHGKIYSITNPEEISILGIVNKILSFQLRATKIKFLKSRSSVDPLYQKAYIPDQNLNEIGWKPVVSFDRGLAHLIDYFKKDISLKDTFDTDYPLSNVVSNTDTQIDVDFDDTVNLSNTFFGVGINADDSEHIQFKDFQKKLNTGLNEKRTGILKKFLGRFSGKKEKIKRSKLFYFKFTVWLSFCLLIYLFFIVPFFRTGLMFYTIKSNSSNLTEVINSDYTEELSYEALSSSSRKSLAGISWIISAFKQVELKNNIISISSGLDSVNAALTIIKEKNLDKYLNSNLPIDQADLSDLQDLLIKLNAAEGQLSEIQNVNLLFGANQEINILRQWTLDTSILIRSKITN